MQKEKILRETEAAGVRDINSKEKTKSIDSIVLVCLPTL